MLKAFYLKKIPSVYTFLKGFKFKRYVYWCSLFFIVSLIFIRCGSQQWKLISNGKYLGKYIKKFFLLVLLRAIIFQWFIYFFSFNIWSVIWLYNYIDFTFKMLNMSNLLSVLSFIYLHKEPLEVFSLPL